MGATDEEFIANLYYAISAGIVAKAAGVLGYREEQEKYQKLSEEQFAVVQEEYYSATGRCCIKTQTALLLTLIVFLKLIAKPVQFGKKPLPLLAAVRTAVIGIVVALLSRRSIIGLIVSREIIAALEPRTEILLIRAALAPHNLVGRLLKIRPQILKIIVRKKAL